MIYQQEIAGATFSMLCRTTSILRTQTTVKAGHLVHIQVPQCIWHYINILASYSVFCCDLTPPIFDLYQSFKLQQ